MVGPTIDSPLEVHSRRPIRWCHCRPPKTYRLATIPHDWHTIVRYDPSRSSRVVVFHVVWKPICNFLLAINSNLGHISHRSAAEARNGLQGHQSSMIFYLIWQGVCHFLALSISSKIAAKPLQIDTWLLATAWKKSLFIDWPCSDCNSIRL